MLNEIIDAVTFWTGTISVATAFGLAVGEFSVRHDKMCHREFMRKLHAQDVEFERVIQGRYTKDTHSLGL